MDTARHSRAISTSGKEYSAKQLGSQTHLLDISSEHAALVRAVQHNDPYICEVRTIVSGSEEVLSPLVAKLLIDHAVRTGVAITYHISNEAGAVLFECSDVQELLPWYKTPGTPLTSISERIPDTGMVSLDESAPLGAQLRTWALAGMVRNFPTRDGASGYGAAVLTASGDIYYGGQYSTYEQRLGVHAEMGVLLNALADGARDITHIGIASSKFTHEPCSPCGCCRQFIAEMAAKYAFSPTIHLFASESDVSATYSIPELLPVQWTNKK